MIDLQYINTINFITEHKEIGVKLEKCRHIIKWAPIYRDIIDGSLKISEITNFTQAEENIAIQVDSFVNKHNIMDTVPANGVVMRLADYSVSPLFLIYKIKQSNSPIHSISEKKLSSQKKIADFLYNRTGFNKSFNKYMVKAWSFNIEEAATYLWDVFDRNPELFFLLISHEYQKAESQTPSIKTMQLQKMTSSDEKNVTIKQKFNKQSKNAKPVANKKSQSISIAMRIIAEAQRHNEIEKAMLNLKNITVNELQNPANKNQPIIDEYLNSLKTSVFGLRQRLMIDCFHPSLLLEGDTLKKLADNNFDNPFFEQNLLDCKKEEKYNLISQISREIYSPIRNWGVSEFGSPENDEAPKSSVKGGHRNIYLNNFYGLNHFQKTCRFIYETSIAANNVIKPCFIGSLAAKIMNDHPDYEVSSWSKKAKIEVDMFKKADKGFGSARHMANFDINQWLKPTASSGKWLLLATTKNSISVEQKKFLEVRSYLTAFFYEPSRLINLKFASKIMAHWAYSYSAFSRDPIWTCIRNTEARLHSITLKSRRNKKRNGKRLMQKINRNRPFSFAKFIK